MSAYRVRRTVVAACIPVMTCLPLAASAYQWLQFNGDPAHSGNDVLEKSIDRNNVASLAMKFQATLPAVADGAPIIARGVQTPSGIRDLLFLTTTAGHIVALDARTGASVWSHQNAAGNCRINNGSNVCFTTSSPAIDPNMQFVYTYGLNDTLGRVHKYQIGDGTEVTTGGWPQTASLKGFHEKGSGALSFATSGGVTYLYVVHGGYPGDAGDYQGHVTAINLATGSQKVFNSMCSNQAVHLGLYPAPPSCQFVQSAIWARGGVTYDASLDRIFMTTGNGSYNGNSVGHNWSETVFKLNPDGSGTASGPLDAYTPSNVQGLDNGDTDLGSTGPAILPVPPNSNVQHLAVQAGKDGKLRLINLADMSGKGGPGNLGGEIGLINVPQGTSVVLTQPAVWVNPADSATWVFVANPSGISGLKLNIDGAGAPSLVSQWSWPQGGTSPIIANGILFYAASNIVTAMNPLNGNLLWSSSQVGGVHWESIVVANGYVYLSDEAAHVTAFGLPVVPTDMDFDFSGTADLLWQNSATGQSGIWLMNGLNATSTSQLWLDPNATILGVGDFNGDDKADIVWRNNTTGATSLWLMNGTTPIGGGVIHTDPNWRVMLVADFDGDGKSDLLWGNTATGQYAIWLMNGATYTAAAQLIIGPEWVPTHTGDFDGDGKADIIWRNTTTGETLMWLMNGLVPKAGGVIHTDINWSVDRVADFDGDGKSDLLWRNSSGDGATWLMDGGSIRASAGLYLDSSWTVVGVGDFDGDGKADLLLNQNGTGTTTMWLMGGARPKAIGVLLTDPTWIPVSVADFNGDGKSDIIWQRNTGEVALWLMNGGTLTSGAGLHSASTWRVANPR